MPSFALIPLPKAANYGASIVSLDRAKAHVRVLHDWEDDLIAALRDAAIDWVERHTAIPLAPSEYVWQSEHLCDDLGRNQVRLGAWPVRSITSITYLNAQNQTITVPPTTVRIAQHDLILPSPGAPWRSDVAGGVRIAFEAGLTSANERPALVHAVLLMLGDFYENREAIITGTISGQAPLGVISLCRAHRLPVLV
jgi:uncharacterized phiE125 gp8 family phage protein